MNSDESHSSLVLRRLGLFVPRYRVSFLHNHCFWKFWHQVMHRCFKSLLEKSGGQAVPRHITYTVELEYSEEPQLGFPKL